MKEVVGTEQVHTEEGVYRALMAIQAKCMLMKQVELEGETYFADGIYAKTMKVPADTFVIGERNRFSAVHVMTKGRVKMFDGPGSEGKELVAPHVYVSPAGDKKMGIFLEDTEWTAVFLNPDNLQSEDELDVFLHVSEAEFLTQLALRGEGDL